MKRNQDKSEGQILLKIYRETPKSQFSQNEQNKRWQTKSETI